MSTGVTVCKKCGLSVPYPAHLLDKGPLTGSTCPLCGHHQEYGRITKP
jgi:hypothetical protein